MCHPCNCMRVQHQDASHAPMEAVRPEVSSATTSGARTGTGSACFARTTPHSLNAPYAISATGSPTLRPAQRKTHPLVSRHQCSIPCMSKGLTETANTLCPMLCLIHPDHQQRAVPEIFLLGTC